MRPTEHARRVVERLRTREGAVDALATVAGVAYVLVAARHRFAGAFAPFALEGDWTQWVWPYWRYHVDGAFPPGHVLTDYAFAVQPPLWWAAMASISRVVSPPTAAALLNVVAFVGAVVGAYLAVRAKANHAMAVAAACLLVRDDRFFQVTAGGYPRSFGPTLVLLFLAAWLWDRHRAVLVVLVVAAAVYPSVVVPCGLAYGMWVVVMERERRVRRFVELAFVGAIVAALALVQNIQAPDWWGPVVTLSQAEQMTALHEGGRNAWVPLPPFWERNWRYALQPFSTAGNVLFPSFTAWERRNDHVVILSFVAAAMFVLGTRRRAYPWQIPLLVASAVVGHALARLLAFKLYLPHRVVQHTLPYVLTVAWPILFHLAATCVLPTRRLAATTLGLVVLLVPVFVVAGDGLQRNKSFGSTRGDAPLFEFARTTPLDAQFAGNLRAVENLPLYGQRQVLVNFPMAHAFRQGYFAEIDRRIVATYRALYATSWDDVVRFLDEEKVDYLVYETTIFRRFETGWGSVFLPPRTEAARLFEAGRGRHVLAQPPEEAIALRHRHMLVVDGAKLKAAIAAGRAPAH
jgi:hypothetical protein